MARSIDDIKKQVTATLVNGLHSIGINVSADTWSSTNVLRMLVFIFSVSANILETLFDTLTSDVKQYIANMKPGSLKWYTSMALQYQHGFPLIAESDEFDNTGKTDEQIQNSKIIKYAACVEAENQHGRMYLRLKLASVDNDELNQLSPVQLAGVKEYFGRIKYAGIPLVVESNIADKIRMKWRIYYDPLLLDVNGNRLDGTADDVVINAIKQYLKQLPFNGIYAIQKHEDYVQQVEGVLLCPVQYAQRQFGVYEWEYISTIIIPEGGYFRFENETDLKIEMIAQYGGI